MPVVSASLRDTVVRSLADSSMDPTTDSFLSTTLPPWIDRFVSNLGVYIIFFVSGYYLLQYVRNRPEPDLHDTSLSARAVRFLFFGYSDSDAKSKNSDASDDSELQKLADPNQNTK